MSFQLLYSHILFMFLVWFTFLYIYFWILCGCRLDLDFECMLTTVFSHFYSRFCYDLNSYLYFFWRLCGCRLDLEWARGRLFDAQVAEVFRRIVAEAGTARVVSVSEKEETRRRPNGTAGSTLWYCWQYSMVQVAVQHAMVVLVGIVGNTLQYNTPSRIV